MRTENDYTETDLGNISPNPRGEYDEKASYEYLDLISYQGGSYLCLAEPKTIVSGIAPKAGQNTEVWQMIALPGDLTSEYIAMHDDTIAKAKQTEASRLAAELAQEAAETARTDVVQMHSETLQAATEARENCDSSAGYAQAAEVSRKAAAESEQNINAQVTGFETEVSESVTQATEQIATARQKAVQTITSQQDTSVQAVKDQTAAYISEKNTEAKKEITDHAEQEIVRINAQDSVQQIQKNKEDVALLKEDLGKLSSSKISKFYATNNGENHLADSDDGKIADMLVYGKSEQKSTTGAQLFDMSTAFAGWVGDDGTPRNDGTIGKADNIVSDYIPVESNTVYACNNNNNNNVFVWEYDSSKTLIKSDGQLNSESFTSSETAKYIVFAVNYSSAQTPDYIKTTMFNKGSSVLPWEPYTGGQPSPSPDYPQEIKSVVNPTVKVYGNNFYSGSDLIGLTKIYVTDFIPVILHKGKICISFDAFSDTSNGNYLINVEYFDANKESIGNNGKADLVGNNISHINFNFDENNAGYNNEALDFKKVLYVKVKFYIYTNTATEITYKNIMISATDSDFEPYKPIQTVTLPYALNAIPVNSGGNVTIDDQQYIADYVDVERGKVVRMCRRETLNTKNGRIDEEYRLALGLSVGAKESGSTECIFSTFEFASWVTCAVGSLLYLKNIKKPNNELYTAQELKELGLDFDVIYQLFEQQETDLPTEQITAFKALATYYPTTNINVNSEQLDGYTVFNYPISMANGWNYVKQQLNDNRDYIYDMDLQSAEAYVNSEYAVALTELEV